MEMSDIPTASLNSVKQALTIATLRKSMNQDTATALTLISDMQQANSKVMEQSVTPFKGRNIDVSV